jgi:SH3 domain protein
MRLLPVISLTLLCGSAVAQPARYVTDTLRLDARSGPGLENRIVRMLESGTRVDLIEESDGWSRVLLPGGEEAWILSRFLMDRRAARERLEETEAALEAARERVTEVQREMEAVRDENAALLEDNQALQRKAADLDTELRELQRTSAAAVAMRDENAGLRRRATELEKRYRILESDNMRLRDASNRDWFMAGAGVLLGGMVLGLIIPKVRFRRRRSWGEL